MAFASYLLPIHRVQSHQSNAYGETAVSVAFAASGKLPQVAASRSESLAGVQGSRQQKNIISPAGSTSGTGPTSPTRPAGSVGTARVLSTTGSAAPAAGGVSVASMSAAAVGAEAQAEDVRFLPRVVFLGRALEDYREMFALENFPEAFTGKRVLDIAAGSAAFAAQARELGVSVTAVDPCYGLQPDALEKLSRQDQETSFAALVEHAEKSGQGRERRAELAGLRAMRELARGLFLRDYRTGIAQGRYIEGALPSLPFADNAFDTVLCGHFLFLYAHLLGEDFHRKAIDELLRVAPEVRIYPLVGLDGKPPVFLDALLGELAARPGISVSRIEMDSTVLGNRVQGLILRRQ